MAVRSALWSASLVRGRGGIFVVLGGESGPKAWGSCRSGLLMGWRASREAEDLEGMEFGPVEGGKSKEFELRVLGFEWAAGVSIEV